MHGLPDSAIYEKALEYWPYITSWNRVLEYVHRQAPQNGSLVDLMCGPGYLLGKIASIRTDLSLKGVDIDKRYIVHAKEKYPSIVFDREDILSWKSVERFDVVTCTGSLHHIPYEQQEQAVQKMASLVKPDGFVIISDSYVGDYVSETERQVAAAQLGFEYLKATIQNGASKPVVQSTIEILWNDVLKKEFKTSLKKRKAVFEAVFEKVETVKTWPGAKTKYGDYVSICRTKV